MPDPRPSLFATFRPLWLPGLLLAMARLISEFASGTKSGLWHPTMMFSVYALMPCLWLSVGLSGALKGQGARRIALGAVLTAALVWFPGNAIGYGTAQFTGWNFGRFTHDAEFHAALQKVGPDASDPNAAAAALIGRTLKESPDDVRAPMPGLTTTKKVTNTAMLSLITTAIGCVYNLLCAGLFVGLLGRLLHRRP